MAKTSSIQITFDFSRPGLTADKVDDLEDETQKLFRILRDLDDIDHVARLRTPRVPDKPPDPRRYVAGVFTVELQGAQLNVLWGAIAPLLKAKALRIHGTLGAQSLDLTTAGAQDWDSMILQMEAFATLIS